MRLRRLCLTCVAIGHSLTVASTTYGASLLRYPDVHEHQVVFTQGGDLWIAPTTGGEARRLTTHPGLELFAKFSPDGRWIAFTGQYDGDEQVYVIPSKGGVPKRLSYYPAGHPRPSRWGFEHQVFGWTPDGQKILFKSARDSWEGSRLYTVSSGGGMPEVLAPPVAGSGVLSPDGQKLFYSPLSRDFRTWKRYQGGWAQNLFIYDLQAQAVKQITSHPRTDRDPMWIGANVYFASDRDGRLNLYTYDLSSQATVALTSYKEADVRWPSSDEVGQIVYEMDGQLHLYDILKKQARALTISIPSDETSARSRVVSVAKHVESFALSPNGRRALLVARGDIFDVPTKKGVVRNLTHSSDAHDRGAQWSPDGKSVVYISDKNGEEELWLKNLATGELKVLTPGNSARLYRPRWSPDGRYIAYGDKEGRIYVLIVAGGKPQMVVDDPGYPSADWTWSPRGGYLAYTQSDTTGLGSIYIYSVQNERVYRVTGGDFHESSPTWGPEGKWLYFTSARNFGLQWGAFDFNYLATKTNVVLAMALQSRSENPFAPEDDPAVGEDTKPNKDKGSKADKEGAEKKNALDTVREAGYIDINFDNIAKRVVRVPIAPGHGYDGMFLTKTHLYYLQSEAGGLGEEGRKLMSFDLEKHKSTEVADNVTDYAFSWDAERFLVRSKGAYTLFEVGKKEGERLSTSGLQAKIDPKQEWQTIFDEVWRRFRDYFYVENMHGNDWVAIKKRYLKQLPNVVHREELNDLLGQMIAELNVSHAYVSGGDLGLPPRSSVSLPGARFAWDEEAKRYKISKIFTGHNQEKKYRSPLTEFGVRAKLGDYVLAINGQALTKDTNPYELLTLPKDIAVELRLSRDPQGKKARNVLFRPIESEANLVYLEHVLGRRRKVMEATEGRVGYLHIPDMMPNGLREFVKWYPSQVSKDGLIVDVRGNGGGFVSQTIIDRLARKVLGTEFSRTTQHVNTYPAVVPVGAMVALINETSGSDGDIFPWAFRAAGLGPLIGKRTWGGVIGITDHGPLLDGGEVYVPEFSINGVGGEYIIEGEGVSPDIEVENDPIAVAKGRDPQLERAITEVLNRIEEQQALPKRPPAAPIR